MAESHEWNQQFGLYLPRVLLDWQLDQTDARRFETDGSFLLVDISGFTALSESLAEKGKVGAEEITEILNEIFTELLDIASLDGGDLLRFGGDALFHLFTGPEHAARACRVALDMRTALEEFEQPGIHLSMSVGVSTGHITAYLAGDESQELLFIGPIASEVVRLQSEADPGEILVGNATVAAVDDEIFEPRAQGGFLLAGEPELDNEWEDQEPLAGTADLKTFIPVLLREQISLAFNQGEHRPATIAFIGFHGTDGHTPDVLEPNLHRLVSIVQDAATRNGIAFLASDVDEDGGKLILATGVPSRSASRGERMIRALREIADSDPPFELHIGVARGHVFAGDLGARFRRVYTVMGDTVNLAARLAAAAQPSEILVTARALDRSSDVFDTEPTASLTLKGKAKTVAPVRILQRVETEGARASRVQEMVGRTDELAVLEDTFINASNGRGRVVQIAGAPGIGKTTLVAEVASRHAISFETVFVDCEQYEANTPYFAAGKLLRAIMGIKHGRAEDIGSDLLNYVHSEAPELEQWTPLLGDVIGGDVPMTQAVQDLDTRFMDAKTRDACVALVAQSLSSPMFLILDDYHWIDPASGAIVEALSVLAEESPLVIGLAHRSNTAEHIPGAQHIELTPLSIEESVSLVQLASVDPVPMPVADSVARRSSGNPFVIVELVQSGLSLEHGELPETIEAVTLARIDMLAPADRKLLRIASVLGETFALNLVADALPDIAPAAQDIEAWRRLEDFVEVGSTGTVRFRQAIVRDAAYEGLPFRQRREIHQAVGDALERRARRRPERFAEVMSFHFEQGENWDKTWEFALMAGERAAKKYANTEAFALFQRALRAGISLDKPLLEVHERVSDSAAIIGLYDDADAALDAALALEPNLADQSRILRKKGLLYVRRGLLDDGATFLERAVSALPTVPQEEEARRSWLLAKIALAGHRMRAGEYEAAATLCTEAIEADVDPDVFANERGKALSSRAAALTHLPGKDGLPDARAALVELEKTSNLHHAAGVHNNLGYDAYYQGDWDNCYQSWVTCAEISEKIGDLEQTAMTLHNIGELRLDQGHFAEAEDLLRKGLLIFRGAKHHIGVAMCACNLGRLLTRTGRFAEARELLDESMTLLQEAGATGLLPEAEVRLAEWHLYARDTGALRETLDACLANLPEGNDTIRSTAARLRAYSYAMDGDESQAVESLHQSVAAAMDSKHERLQANEALTRITGSSDEDTDSLAAQMGIVARPVTPTN